MVIHRIVPNLKVDDAGTGHDFYTNSSAWRRRSTWLDRELLGPRQPRRPGEFGEFRLLGTEDSVMSVDVADVDTALRPAQHLGYQIVHPLTDEPWGVRRFLVRDPHGNVINIVGHPG
jgi:catechol 2,3-dioxygenase-like lactoylglutathione lyase family enzyme